MQQQQKIPQINSLGNNFITSISSRLQRSHPYIQKDYCIKAMNNNQQSDRFNPHLATNNTSKIINQINKINLHTQQEKSLSNSNISYNITCQGTNNISQQQNTLVRNNLPVLSNQGERLFKNQQNNQSTYNDQIIIEQNSQLETVRGSNNFFSARESSGHSSNNHQCRLNQNDQKTYFSLKHQVEILSGQSQSKDKVLQTNIQNFNLQYQGGDKQMRQAIPDLQQNKLLNRLIPHNEGNVNNNTYIKKENIVNYLTDKQNLTPEIIMNINQHEQMLENQTIHNNEQTDKRNNSVIYEFYENNSINNQNDISSLRDIYSQYQSKSDRNSQQNDLSLRNGLSQTNELILVNNESLNNVQNYKIEHSQREQQNQINNQINLIKLKSNNNISYNDQLIKTFEQNQKKDQNNNSLFLTSHNQQNLMQYHQLPTQIEYQNANILSEREYPGKINYPSQNIKDLNSNQELANSKRLVSTQPYNLQYFPQILNQKQININQTSMKNNYPQQQTKTDYLPPNSNIINDYVPLLFHEKESLAKTNLLQYGVKDTLSNKNSTNKDISFNFQDLTTSSFMKNQGNNQNQGMFTQVQGQRNDIDSKQLQGLQPPKIFRQRHKTTINEIDQNHKNFKTSVNNLSICQTGSYSNKSFDMMMKNNTQKNSLLQQILPNQQNILLPQQTQNIYKQQNLQNPPSQIIENHANQYIDNRQSQIANGDIQIENKNNFIKQQNSQIFNYDNNFNYTDRVSTNNNNYNNKQNIIQQTSTIFMPKQNYIREQKQNEFNQTTNQINISNERKSNGHIKNNHIQQSNNQQIDSYVAQNSFIQLNYQTQQQPINSIIIDQQNNNSYLKQQNTQMLIDTQKHNNQQNNSDNPYSLKNICYNQNTKINNNINKQCEIERKIIKNNDSVNNNDINAFTECKDFNNINCNQSNKVEQNIYMSERQNGYHNQQNNNNSYSQINIKNISSSSIKDENNNNQSKNSINQITESKIRNNISNIYNNLFIQEQKKIIDNQIMSESRNHVIQFQEGQYQQNNNIKYLNLRKSSKSAYLQSTNSEMNEQNISQLNMINSKQIQIDQSNQQIQSDRMMGDNKNQELKSKRSSQIIFQQASDFKKLNQDQENGFIDNQFYNTNRQINLPNSQAQKLDCLNNSNNQNSDNCKGFINSNYFQNDHTNNVNDFKHTNQNDFSYGYSKQNDSNNNYNNLSSYNDKINCKSLNNIDNNNDNSNHLKLTIVPNKKRVSKSFLIPSNQSKNQSPNNNLCNQNSSPFNFNNNQNQLPLKDLQQNEDQQLQMQVQLNVKKAKGYNCSIIKQFLKNTQEQKPVINSSRNYEKQETSQRNYIQPNNKNLNLFHRYNINSNKKISNDNKIPSKAPINVTQDNEYKNKENLGYLNNQKSENIDLNNQSNNQMLNTSDNIQLQVNLKDLNFNQNCINFQNNYIQNNSYYLDQNQQNNINKYGNTQLSSVTNIINTSNLNNNNIIPQNLNSSNLKINNNLNNNSNLIIYEQNQHNLSFSQLNNQQFYQETIDNNQNMFHHNIANETQNLSLGVNQQSHINNNSQIDLSQINIKNNTQKNSIAEVLLSKNNSKKSMNSQSNLSFIVNKDSNPINQKTNTHKNNNNTIQTFNDTTSNLNENNLSRRELFEFNSKEKPNNEHTKKIRGSIEYNNILSSKNSYDNIANMQSEITKELKIKNNQIANKSIKSIFQNKQNLSNIIFNQNLSSIVIDQNELENVNNQKIQTQNESINITQSKFNQIKNQSLINGTINLSQQNSVLSENQFNTTNSFTQFNTTRENSSSNLQQVTCIDRELAQQKKRFAEQEDKLSKLKLSKAIQSHRDTTTQASQSNLSSFRSQNEYEYRQDSIVNQKNKGNQIINKISQRFKTINDEQQQPSKQELMTFCNKQQNYLNDENSSQSCHNYQIIQNPSSNSQQQSSNLFEKIYNQQNQIQTTKVSTISQIQQQLNNKKKSNDNQQIFKLKLNETISQNQNINIIKNWSKDKNQDNISQSLTPNSTSPTTSPETNSPQFVLSQQLNARAEQIQVSFKYQPPTLTMLEQIQMFDIEQKFEENEKYIKSIEDVSSIIQGEQDYLIDQIKILNNPIITQNVRCNLIDWVQRQGMKYFLKRETIHKAIYFIDKYLSSEISLKEDQLYLIAITCIFLASKQEEIYPPTLDDMLTGSQFASQKNIINKQELQIIENLKWKLNPVTACFWMDFVMAQWDKLIQTKNIASYPFRIKDKLSYMRYREAYQMIDYILLDTQILHQHNLRILCITVAYLVICKHSGFDSNASNQITNTLKDYDFFNFFQVNIQEIKECSKSIQKQYQNLILDYEMPNALKQNNYNQKSYEEFLAFQSYTPNNKLLFEQKYTQQL